MFGWAKSLSAIVLLTAAVGAELKTASTHAMRYYVSLPSNWSAAKAWPVVFIIDSADREFDATAKLFETARGARPFILVTPMVISNGGPRYRSAPAYRYSEVAWAAAEKAGSCRFDTDGLAAVAADVRREYHGREGYYIAGLEAAGHTIWMQIFTRPEALRGAALIAPNFQARCLEEIGYSNAASRKDLPVKVLGGARDELWAEGKPFYAQTVEARRVAVERGYSNISQTVVPGKGHEWMPAEVLDYFAQLEARQH